MTSSIVIPSTRRPPGDTTASADGGSDATTSDFGDGMLITFIGFIV
jgi:hypothetical protein